MSRDWSLIAGKFKRRRKPELVLATSNSAQRIRFRKINTSAHSRRDLYHWLLTLSWPRFAAFILAAYVAVNVLFCLVYYFVGGIAEMRPHSFSDAYFFSVETLATVGYGHMYPVTFAGHLVTAIEIMSGLFGIAVVTGLIFVRFSRPVAAMVFTDNLVWRPYDGKPCLMFRVANLRHQSMAEAEFRFMMVRDQDTLEGDSIARFCSLDLEFDHMIAFPAALTIRHIITEKSPLHGLGPEGLQKQRVRFLASVVCIDTVIPASVQSQKYYTWRQIQFGRRFVEIYTDEEEDLLTVDYGRFHDTEEMPPVKP